MLLPSAWRARWLDDARTRVSVLTRRLGFDVTRFDRGKLIKHHRITVVFDVGANAGQYATELRALGYAGRIVSCEPLADAFRRLSARAASDPDWTALQLALGDADRTATINVAANSQSSSLLDMLPRHREAAPHTSYQGTEEVKMVRLDTIFDDHVRADDRVLVKLDVQGYERFVLAGAQRALPRVLGWQLEMSLVPLYRGEATYLDLIGDMSARGFQLMSLDPVFRDPRSGQLLAVDGLFFHP
jgi:FkbM family methyltransferase